MTSSCKIHLPNPLTFYSHSKAKMISVRTYLSFQSLNLPRTLLIKIKWSRFLCLLKTRETIICYFPARKYLLYPQQGCVFDWFSLLACIQENKDYKITIVHLAYFWPKHHPHSHFFKLAGKEFNFFVFNSFL